jgi:hypothetical protein
MIHVEHYCNFGNTQWHLGEEGMEKRMIENQQYPNALHPYR